MKKSCRNLNEWFRRARQEHYKVCCHCLYWKCVTVLCSGWIYELLLFLYYADISVDELQKVTSPEDKQFCKFSSRIKRNPDQVLRYNRGGEPLWISSHHIPNKDDIPCCEYCGQHRQFEFQVSIESLHYLVVGEINSMATILRNEDTSGLSNHLKIRFIMFQVCVFMHII